MPNDRAKRKRRGRYGVLVTILIVAAFCFALILTSGLFFKVSDIRVEGAYAVDSADVIRLSGYTRGDNMFLINKASAARAITTGMPYVRSVRVRRDWPGGVVIVITESAPAAKINHRGINWLFDAQGRLLEIAFTEPSLPVVTGFALIDPMIGTAIYPYPGDAAKLEPLLTLLRVLLAEEILRDVSEIDISRLSNVTFTYLNKYKVELGPPEAIEKKISMMLMALEDERVSARGPGTFILADAAEDRPVRFVPGN
jgi:cell division protein FtsQ